MANDLRLRPALATDIPDIIDLYVKTVLTIGSADYDDQQLEIWSNLGRDHARWERRIASQYFLVAELEGQIAGFGSLTNENYLDVLYVSKDFQRRGIANLLFDALLKQAFINNGAKITADVSKTARAFFERKGFVMINENKNLIGEVVIVNYRMEWSDRI
ncbi:GNAT family N-acetyltransferase [Pedobacter sp. JY14-1]|uniref:GNAT family N-acetyltransferase n=1 Tax=Pedobacter sp. JY14-1 TaxID=3034151 RepID=UPI0023E0DFEF|nr:GNAT family N-acetyltransferase [Pedobacter sp. JY14-1]